MKLKAQDINLASGAIKVAVIHTEDATRMGVHHGDRIGLTHKNHHAHAIVDLTDSTNIIKPGSIGLFEEVISALKVKSGQFIHLEIERKPASLRYIKEKMDGKKLTKEKIFAIVRDVADDTLSPVEIAFFIGSSYMHDMSYQETAWLTEAMIAAGEQLKLKSKVVFDKHCIGGVAGNRTTPIVVPIIAAADFYIPKTSSRAITSPAGTADTMEVLAPVTMELPKMKKIVQKAKGCVVWGGAMNLAPADDKFIQVEHTLNIDPESQLLASILAKKGSVSATHVLIDIPMGKKSKIKTKKEAEQLASEFLKLGKLLGMKIEYLLTNGNQPIGNGIGPALEAKDILKVLQRSDSRPMDLEEKSVMMAGLMLEMGNYCRKGQGRKKAQELLNSGKALKKMQEIIKLQGGNPRVHSSDIPVGKHMFEVRAQKAGKIKEINNHKIARLAKVAGAPLDQGAGCYLHVHEGDLVEKGDDLLTIHAETKEKLEFAKDVLKQKPIVL